MAIPDVWEPLYVDGELVADVMIPPGRPARGHVERITTSVKIMPSSCHTVAPYTTYVFIHEDVRYAMYLPRRSDQMQVGEASGLRQWADEPSPFGSVCRVDESAPYQGLPGYPSSASSGCAVESSSSSTHEQDRSVGGSTAEQGSTRQDASDASASASAKH